MIYNSYYKKTLKEFVKDSLSELEASIFWFLYSGFSVEQKLQSSYFQLFRVGDSKYTLTIQKYIDNTYSIKFIINKKSHDNKKQKGI